MNTLQVEEPDANNYQILKDKSANLKTSFFLQSFDIVPLIMYSVDNSTFRAFHQSQGYVKTYKPSSIFRVWAYNFLTKNIEVIKSKENFESLRSIALEELENFWKSEDRGTPKFYQLNKLIDLFFKALPLWNKLDIETKEWIFNNTNVPLDKFSLALLRKWSSELEIHENASMNFINEKNYDEFQKAIKDICKSIDIPVIVFDLFAWNESHKPKESFKLIELDKKKQKTILS